LDQKAVEQVSSDAAPEPYPLDRRSANQSAHAPLPDDDCGVDADLRRLRLSPGMGEHYVAVSPSSVNVRYDEKNSKWLASMNTTKEALKAAPEFKYPK
jgi:hypothetical protein